MTFRLNASTRIKAAKAELPRPRWLSSNDWELLNIWFNFGQFDDAVHGEILQVFEKIHKNLPAASKLPKSLAHRGFVFKSSDFDASMKRSGRYALKPAILSSWTLSQKIALDYAKMASPTEVGVIVSKSLKPAEVLMYASPQVLKAVGISVAEPQQEVIVRGTGLPNSGLLYDLIDYVWVPKLKKAVGGEQYLRSKGIEV